MPIRKRAGEAVECRPAVIRVARSIQERYKLAGRCPLAMYLVDIYTISCNLAGLPGISIPCGFTRAKLPIGLQILAPPFEEEKLLRVARMHERATDWYTRWPSL